VYSDLLAAAHATLGNSAGIACILGTGSNSCFYDGEKITEHIPPLGFILGDEGSGAVLGRKLLADFLKKIMPYHLSEKFQKQFPLKYSDFLESTYRKEKPNQFLARFVPFLRENIHERYCTTLVEESFDDFIKRNISGYTSFENFPVTFVGSVAFYFQEQLKNVLKSNHLQLNKVMKEPLNGLITFYTENKI
jgi:N-acetylglucosamine kinase-like BadF-type ATPase